MQALNRIDWEIRNVEHLLLNGHSDVQGLTLALTDWSRERDLLIQSLHDPAERNRLYSEFISARSNPGDLVLDPFAGIGSTGYVALQNKRKFLGIELKESYWKVGCQYLHSLSK